MCLNTIWLIHNTMYEIAVDSVAISCQRLEKLVISQIPLDLNGGHLIVFDQINKYINKVIIYNVFIAVLCYRLLYCSLK